MSRRTLFHCVFEKRDETDVKICVPGNNTASPWTLSRNRQEHSDGIYLDIWEHPIALPLRTSTSAMSLLSLPVELRLRIYDYLLPPNPSTTPPKTYTRVLYSCRDVHGESDMQYAVPETLEEVWNLKEQKNVRKIVYEWTSQQQGFEHLLGWLRRQSEKWDVELIKRTDRPLFHVMVFEKKVYLDPGWASRCYQYY
ncbi:hypothetical protein BU23DRAFT_599579 [Bimuria novae-zelandiae CBS 107.79]|uniref:Uncharacterized protein n=1 Tax=Bimuria novae-zelandiae CBS 107.79 TaxID=1447943 RepID=A0A6A5V8Y4_9PLEO|nr:hypothetical protein BU23DRAFT_599579 [Bimuria novae-zelandiae CBS 107.79]